MKRYRIRQNLVEMMRVCISKLHRERYAVVTGLLVLLVYLTFTLQFQSNDDPQIMNAISGLYTGEPRTMAFHMLAPYSCIIALLYRITTIVPWYSLAFLVIDLASLVVLCKVFTRDHESLPRYIAFLGLAISMYLYSLVNVQYTTVAGIAGSAAVTLICSWNEARRACVIRPTICAALLVFLAYNIRNQSGIITIIAIVYILGYNWLVLRRRNKTQTLAVLACISVVAVSYIVNVGYAHCAGWDDNIRYQKAREQYKDYPRPSYDDSRDEYAVIGWDESAATLIQSWCYRLEEANTEDFVEIRRLFDDNQELHDTTSIVQRLTTFVGAQPRECILMVVEAIWLALFWIRSVIQKDRSGILNCCLFATGFYAMQLVFIGYMIAQGRYKERAMYMTFYICSMPMFKITLDSLVDRAKGHLQWGLHLSCAILLTVLVIVGFKRTQTRSIAEHHVIDGVESYVQANQDNLYMLDTSLLRGWRMFRSFDDDHLLTNMFWWGSWLIGSPFDKDQLELNGLDSLTLIDMLEDGRYYISTNDGSNGMGMIDDYYNSRFDNITCDIVYSTDAFIVYSYRLAN